jgi:hypothetical protein
MKKINLFCLVFNVKIDIINLIAMIFQMIIMIDMIMNFIFI